MTIILIFVLMAFGGCTSGSGHSSQSNTFKDDAELEAYLKDQFASTMQPSGEFATMVVPDKAGDSDGTENFSQTNVQESGVDESDMVKTDGVYQYVAAAGAVQVVKAVPYQTMQILSSVSVDGSVDSLFLYPKSHILVVLWKPAGMQWSGLADLDSMVCNWIQTDTKTGILLVDVSNPAQPRRIKSLLVDGNLVSARLIENRLHVIQQFRPQLPVLETVYDGREVSRQENIAQNKNTLADLSLQDLTPGVEVFDGSGKLISQGMLVAAQNFYRPDEPGGGSMVTVTTFNLDDVSLPFVSVGMVADAQEVYASTKALYLVATLWNVNSENDFWHEFTNIHKFSLDTEKVEYIASGQVTGRILNQFSLGEYEDVLRIATTYSSEDVWSNAVYCLKADGQQLAIIGKLEDIAKGEQIYAARFLGKRGFLVTFQQIDPLFTLDLADPTAPALVGKLKVPGYSGYIHPLGEDYLLTIGKDVVLQDDTAWYQGLQISIFDVRNFSNPRLLQQTTIGVRGSESEALFNHKAFMFWSEKGLLAIPVDLAEYQSTPVEPWEYGVNTFSGLYVYRVSVQDGFNLLGRIQMRTPSTDEFWYSSWTRGIFIGDAVYAVDEYGVRAALTDDINATLKSILF